MLAAAAILLAGGLAPQGETFAAESFEPPLRLRAAGGRHSNGATSLFDVSIRSWSTPEEHASVVRAAAEGSRVPRGDTTLRDLLQASDSRGRITVPGAIGLDVRYAYAFDDDGGRRIVLAADRPIDAEEASDSGALSLDYNVTIAVIELDESGRGEGELWAAAEITLDADGRVKATGIDVDPIRLGSVRVVE
jgi:hypothetical protein